MAEKADALNIGKIWFSREVELLLWLKAHNYRFCLLYTSDAADE